MIRTTEPTTHYVGLTRRDHILFNRNRNDVERVEKNIEERLAVGVELFDLTP